MLRFLASFFCFALAAAFGPLVHATPIMVTELGIGANETVFINSSTLGSNLHVYAGVVKLDVGGSLMDGFCIDPWHWSASGPQLYNSIPLSVGPKDPTGSGMTGMGAGSAQQIEQLWLHYYSPTISNVNAAALQIKIWQIVDGAEPGGTFGLVSVDNDSAAVYTTLTNMTTFLATNPSAPSAQLRAVSGPNGQDYVVVSTPDSGATAVLLGFALLGLAAVRRKFARN